MLLLPGSLSSDPRLMSALCEGLPSNAPLARHLQSCRVEPFDGTWGDAERSAHGDFPQNPDNKTTAFATPMHAALGLSDLTPTDPDLLQLSNEDSESLCAAADQLMKDEGVRLTWRHALKWQVSIDRAITVQTERPEWIIGESMRPNLPRGADARLIERWMNEMQMLLYTHPINETRQRAGLPAVNALWLWGFDSTGQTDTAHDPVVELRMLRAFRSGDLAGWQRAWGELSELVINQSVVILGDSRPRLKLVKQEESFALRLKSLFKSPQLATSLLALQKRGDQ